MDTADSTEPIERNDPIESTEPKEPTEPTESAEPTEPTEPIDSTEFFEAIERIESWDAIAHFELAGRHGDTLHHGLPEPASLGSQRVRFPWAGRRIPNSPRGLRSAMAELEIPSDLTFNRAWSPIRRH